MTTTSPPPKNSMHLLNHHSHRMSVPLLMLLRQNNTNCMIHKIKKGRCCFVNENIIVSCEDENIQNDKEFILNIQKAMLVTLFESKKINHFQYEYAIELLEKNYRKK